MKKVLLLIAGCLSLNFGSLNAQIIENFESASAWRWAPWVQNVATTNIGTVSAAYMYSGTKGWAESSGTTWFYRTDVLFGSIGHKIGAWIKPAGPVSSGRNYLGFGAKATGCFSVVAAPNTSTFIIQQNAGYGYLDLVSAPVTWNKTQWYYMEATFIATNQVTARLYNSAMTLLSTITMPASGTLSPGGAAFRTFFDGAFDDIGLNIPLPINLLEFVAKADESGKASNLKWTTGAETNNRYFIVERSIDGESFDRLTTMNGAGNSSVINEYSFVDQNPYNGKNYYRLRQVDNDGKSTTSDVVAVSFSSEPVTAFNLYPTVSKGDVKLQLNDQEDQKITVYNISGQQVAGFNVPAGNGKMQEVNLSDLPQGWYSVSCVGKSGAETKRLFIEK